MGLENWGTSHPVTLAIVLVLIGSFGLSPFSNDIRLLYAALPKGIRAVRRASLLNALRRAHLQMSDPTTVVRQLIIRCSVLFLYGIIGLFSIFKEENRRFDSQFHEPLSSADRALGNSRTILDFILVAFTVAAAMIAASLVTVWQYRRPSDQVTKLTRKLEPLTAEEDLKVRLRK
jgi:hypothetical protein